MCDTYPDSEVLFTPIEPIPPEPPVPPVLCNDTTFRGQQTVLIEERFDQTVTFAGPHLTSWGYISPTEEIYTLIGQGTCAGGNMTYQPTCVQVNHYTTPATLDHPALIDPNPFIAAVNVIIGTSDEPIYGFRWADFQLQYPNSGLKVNYVLPGGLVAVTGENMFCKKGTSVYFACHETISPFDHHIVEYDAASGLFLNDFDPLKQFIHTQMAATSGFLYVLAAEIASPTQVSVKKIDRTTGAVSATFMLDDIGATMIGVVNDNLIYVLAAEHGALYYIKNFTDLVYVGNDAAQGFTPAGNVTGMFVNGAFYYGGNGLGGFSTSIFRILVACPEEGNAIVASVGRGSASVADGATINATWANVVDPTVNDIIELHEAPTGGDLGFTAASLINSQPVDGNSSGTIVYTIPGGTAAGTYVFMYVANGDAYVATSPTFEVT